jgi:hypothetical protein
VRETLPALVGIVGRVREVAGVHVRDRLVERHLGLGVDRRPREAPVQVGHLEEHEVLRPALLGGEAHAPQTRAEDDARDPSRGQARELDEFASVQRSRNVQCTSDSQYTGTCALDWSRPRSAFRAPDR